ncbi:MAG: diaminopropionate ammonia-lyase [bacterium]|nr:diaminopropionate ammonia-lyase [bacterium]
MATALMNPFRKDVPDWSAPELAYLELIRNRVQLPFHRSLPDYTPTPLREMPELAAELGLGAIFVKDEGPRFGLGAFKGLGASYAIFRQQQAFWLAVRGHLLDLDELRSQAMTREILVFTAATDGNHGRAVAWAVRNYGDAAVIFMPDDTAPSRIAAIEELGAEARLIAGTFDDCVTACDETARREGWQVIADTAYPGYMEVPGYIMTGYSTIFCEIDEQLGEKAPGDLDAVFLPAGVGGIAGAGTAHYVQTLGADRPKLVCVEPDRSACFLESIAAGEPVAAKGDQRSLMAGLNCGLPSLLAWPVIRDGMDLFLAMEDRWAEEAMRAAWREGITAGESGAAALAGLLALMKAPELADVRTASGFGSGSNILVVNTEGATDPENHQRIVRESENPG